MATAITCEKKIFRNFPGILENIVKLIIKRNQTFKNFLSRPAGRRRPSEAGGWWARRPAWLRRAGGSVLAGLLLGLALFVWWWRRHPVEPVRLTDLRPLVVIDAGHGGIDGGTQGFGVLEKRVALATALRTSRELRQRGVRTALTRETDVALTLEDRVRFTNERNAAPLSAIHCNFSVEAPAVRGVETFYSDPKDLSAEAAIAATLGVAAGDPAVAAASTSLADAVRAAIATRAETPDRGTRNRPELAVTRRTRCPAVLVECAYLSNRADAARAATPEWQAALARGLADGVEAWLARQKGD